MHEELLALAAELRQATDHIKLNMNRFATIAGRPRPTRMAGRASKA
jgi:hypothetical protein